MEERFKFRRVNEITGTLVILVAMALVAALVWTGHSQCWFKSRVTLRIVLPEAGAAGIRQGSEVYFLGTLVGSVSDVNVDSTGRMEAEANIRRDFFRFVRADSSAVIKKKFGVAGDSFFEITRGEGRPLPEKNASIVCNEQFQSALESAIEEIRSQSLAALKKANTGLDTWTQLGGDLGETRQHLNQLIARLDTITAGVEQGKGTAGKLITDTALADEAQKLLARANETMSELQGMVTNLNVAVKNIQDGTARLPEITDAVADGTKDLPGLVQQTQTSMREVERLVEAMQKTWLLRKYVNKTNPPPLNPQTKPVPLTEDERTSSSIRGNSSTGDH
jgi:phospholipid/cholesterol/gamma-HCH transport system substrate-binding protein